MWLPIAGAIAVAAGLGFVVARDGSPAWQGLRLVTVLVAVGVAASRLAHGRPWVRLGAAFGLALVAVPVGIGIGIPFLTKAGWTFETVAGLLALAGGFALFGWALVSTLRTTRRRAGWPACALAVVAVLLASWTLGQAVAATNVPRTGLGTRRPADVGLVARSVRFDATDGVSLSGWYVASRNGAAVVLLHGAGSTREAVLDHAAVLARRGYGVLLFDACGHGRSDGRAMDFGWYGDRDLGGAVAFVAARPDVDPRRVAAVGMSMGGEEALGAAATDRRIKAVVAEGATNRVAADKGWLSDEFGARGAVSEAIGSLTYTFADLLTSAGPPVSLHDAVRAAAPRPVLLIAAGDVPDEARAARFIRSGSPRSVELWVVPGTGHTQALRTHPREWARRVVGFLDHALDVPTGDAG